MTVIMKQNTIYTAFIILLISLSACNLDRSPLTNLSREVVWSSEENATVALTGVYRGAAAYSSPEYSPSDWWTYGGLVFLEFASDNLYDRRGGNSNFFKLSSGQLVPNNAYLRSYWANSYTRIGRCNEFLDNINKLPETSVTKRYTAEVRFIRATQYFYLSQYFYDVPLVTTVLPPAEVNVVDLRNRSQIVDFVIKELKDAIPDLPRYSQLTDTEQGRVSKQAALAFLGRTYLGEKRWSEAAEAYKQIIDFGDNIIDADYQSLFQHRGEGSDEIIFSVQYLEGLAGNALHQHALPAKDGGWCIINPTGSLFEAYQFTDGTDFSYEDPRYDPFDLQKNRDPRLGYTILYNGSVFKGKEYISHPDSTSSPDKVMGGQTTQTGFLLRKFLDESYNGALTLYGGDLPIIRYAEVLLSYLEAKIEAGDPITQELLDATINQVRQRPSVNMPPITTAAGGREEILQLTRNERRVELAGEGLRYWDILRWELGDELLNGDIYGAPFKDSERKRQKKGLPRDPYDRWYVHTRSFRTPQDYRWPIPRSEQDINPNFRD